MPKCTLKLAANRAKWSRYGNLNTPTAILYSAIIYVLRSLIVSDLPLNQGCLTPIKVIVPPGSLLAPNDEVAVCAGNVESSQRVTDVIIKAFQACAASQGGCNKYALGLSAAMTLMQLA